jgi:hypothetical protein
MIPLGSKIRQPVGKIVSAFKNLVVQYHCGAKSAASVGRSVVLEVTNMWGGGESDIVEIVVVAPNFKAKVKLVASPRWAPDTKTDLPTDCRSKCDFDFDFGIVTR